MSDQMRPGRLGGAEDDDLRVGEPASPEATEEVVERMREHLQHADDSPEAMADPPARPRAPVRPDVGDASTPPSTTQLTTGERAAPIGEDSPQSAAQAAGEKVGETIGQARKAASKVADRANEQADQALNIAGERLGDAAQALREQAPAGAAGEIAERAADTLERGGTYLRDSDLSSIVADVSMAVRRNPLPWALGAVGLGFVLSRRRGRRR